MPVREIILVHLRLDIDLFDLGPILQLPNLDLIVKMTNITNDTQVFHLRHMISRNDLAVAGRCDKNVGNRQGLFNGHHLKPLHGCLQSADRINLGNNHARAITAHRPGATLTNVPITANHHNLTGQHNIRGPFDSVGQRFTAAVKVVEL